jgi:hypothetical protein
MQKGENYSPGISATTPGMFYNNLEEQITSKVNNARRQAKQEWFNVFLKKAKQFLAAMNID